MGNKGRKGKEGGLKKLACRGVKISLAGKGRNSPENSVDGKAAPSPSSLSRGKIRSHEREEEIDYFYQNDLIGFRYVII